MATTEKDETAPKLMEEGIVKGSFSKGLEGQGMIRIRRIRIKEALFIQTEELSDNQAFHRNIPYREFTAELVSLLSNYGQAAISTESAEYTILRNRKGNSKVIRKAGTLCGNCTTTASHNRKKKYLLEEGRPVPFLIDLGVMKGDGSIIKSRYDKFRQINRFLEFIDDILPSLEEGAGTEQPITIIDFGCGKSYLTFAVYYFLSEIKGLNVRIKGLDLKAGVIRDCSALVKKYNYTGLEFVLGDIAGYKTEEEVDIVISLHACNTATDHALAQAIRWNTRIILAVPCCQHEVNAALEAQLKTGKESAATAILKPALRFGIIRERMAALVTDAVRAEVLEGAGYNVQLLEFIDMEHTPKNILIRAVKTNRADGGKTRPENSRDLVSVFGLEDALCAKSGLNQPLVVEL